MRFRKVDKRYLDYGLFYDKCMGLAEAKFHAYEPVFITYRMTRRTGSSGVAVGRAPMMMRMILRLGTDPKDARHVIMHETAHCIVGVKQHEEKFYLNLFRLISALGEDVLYSVEREKNYKPRASQSAARKLRITA